MASTAVGVGMGSLGMITGERNSALLRHVKTAYEQLKAGKITRGQHDYIRKKSLDTLQTKLGPMEKVLFKGKTVHEAVRIVRSGAIPATDGIVKEAARFSKVAKLATRGNVVLGAVGVGMTCWDIHDINNRQKQNEIFVESVGGGVIGAGVGYVALILVSGPVGIVAALTITLASSAGAWAGGKLSRNVYSRYGNRVDLVGVTGVGSLCR